VGDVTRDSFAARAGLRQGDVILSIDGQRIDSQRAYDRYLYRARGPRVPIIVLRGNDRHTFYYDSGVFVRDGRRFDDRVATGGAWLGVYLDYDQPDRAILRGVEPNSPAARAGLRAGDTILSVNDAEIRSPDELTQLIGDRNPGERVDLRLAGESRDPIAVTLGERPVTRGAAVDVSPRGINVDAGGVDVNVSPRGVEVDNYRDRRRNRR
jgi:serine protease Do